MLYDIAVIGGGINGCGCAADAAMRGLSVILCEQDDLAGHTSSSSTKLIHGGLRYLEHYQFGMVKHALDEQAILLEIAPHLIHALAFVLPNQPHIRAVWRLRCGLFLYDHLSRRNPLPNSQRIERTAEDAYLATLQPSITSGFLYYDCMTDDARLTLSVALQAEEHGARIFTRTTLIRAQVSAGHWLLTFQPQQGRAFQIEAKTVINAAGPWVPDVANMLKIPVKAKLSFVKGSHIVVPALYQGKHAYMLQHTDKRIVFVIPYHGYSMVGTTDVVIADPKDNQGITTAECDYLQTIIAQYFGVKPTTIVTSWSGVRLLLHKEGQSASQLSRDYVLEWRTVPGPVLSIYGGKLTAYRGLAKAAIDHLRPIFPDLPLSRSQGQRLPGSFWSEGSFADYVTYARAHYIWLDSKLLDHYLSHYGTRTDLLLAACQSMDDLGPSYGSILRQREVDYLRRHEWAQSVDDILWRRTKLGLSISAADKALLAKAIGSPPIQA